MAPGKSKPEIWFDCGIQQVMFLDANSNLGTQATSIWF
jgi:hypothetical protein